MPKQNSQTSKIHKNMIWLSLGLCAVGVILGALHVLSINRIVEKEISAELVLTGLQESLTMTPPAEKFVGARVKGPAGLVEALADNKKSEEKKKSL